MGTSTRPAMSLPSPAPGAPSAGGKPIRNQPTDPVEPMVTSSRRRVFIAAENRLLRDALTRMLAKRSELDISGQGSVTEELIEHLEPTSTEVLLLSSTSALAEDLTLVRTIRKRLPEVRILLLGMNGGSAEFLQCVRAGVAGYLPRDASAEEVLEGIRTVCEGGAVCSASLCLLLFRYFERESSSLPSATVRERLGFTRREQQIIPLIAQGFSNKEIASHFCLSEQTVKNHLYRMKQKAGAGDRLSIVRLCRTQGFLV